MHYFPGKILYPLFCKYFFAIYVHIFSSLYDGTLFLFNFQFFFLQNRLEKDRNFNYIWVRCAKLVCVSSF